MGLGHEYFSRRRLKNFSTPARYFILVNKIYLRFSSPTRTQKTLRTLGPILKKHPMVAILICPPGATRSQTAVNAQEILSLSWLPLHHSGNFIIFLRRGRELNPRMAVLQTAALPLRHHAKDLCNPLYTKYTKK